MIRRRSIARTLASALLFTLIFGCGNALAAAVDDGPLDRDAFLEHRRQEAARKEVLTKGLLIAQEMATANQALYDVHYYDLDLTLDPATRHLAGIVATTAEVTGDSIATVDLDLRSPMTVSSVLSGGAGTTFDHDGSVLTVDLDRTYFRGETVSIVVSYGGDPSGEAFGWSSYDGQPMIWTLSEPFGARDWWPCKDLNSDKADSVSIRCTVPSNLVVASNGLLQSDLTIGDLRTFHWKTNYPTATYLISLAIHPYYRYSHWYTPQAGGDPMEVQYFVYDDAAHIADIEANYDLTVPMIEYFSQGYGEYPFVNEKYGHADFVWGGGMEHQTITSLGWWSMDIISHELAHQWWGDMVTCDDFRHIWLNEGFATWSEAYWAEHHDGFEAYQQYMEFAAYYGPGTIIVEDPLHEPIFDGGLSYNKGSWIVHMLRGVLGDEDFFAGITAYRALYEYDSATTEQLRDVLESVSGLELDAFFQQWIYGEYFPVYQLRWWPVSGQNSIQVMIEQVQENAGTFTMPIRLRIETDAGPVDVTVQNSAASETYTIAVSGNVTDIQLDPDNWILREVRAVIDPAALDQGILLVNSVHWDTYSLELQAAYTDSVFWGDLDITFWDCYDEPAFGYPPSLPEPIGHGVIPIEVISNFSTVIWVGENTTHWRLTPIRSYLESGGNVLLLTNNGADILESGLSDYLGVTWAETEATLVHCLAAAEGLIDIPFTGSQSDTDVFLTTVDPGSLLFDCLWGFPESRGLGAWVAPPEGGFDRDDGGRLALIAGRPYRMDRDALRLNVEYILRNLLLEPYFPGSPVDDVPEREEHSVTLGSAYPNPFNPVTVIPFRLAGSTRVTLDIHDARGRRIVRLVEAHYRAGDHEIRWDGLDRSGRKVSSGSYFVRLRTTEGEVRTKNLVLVR